MFWTYKYDDYSMWDQCGEPKYEEVELMYDCIRKNRNISSFTEIEKGIWGGVNGKYAHVSDDGQFIPDILVLKDENSERIYQLFREHKSYELLLRNFTALYKKVEDIFKKYSHSVLHNHIGYYIRMELYAARMMAVHDFAEDNVLKLPEDTNKSSLGMHIILK